MWKLCGAFTTNNLLMPLAVSSVQSLLSRGGIVGQSFYERTGFILFAVVLMSIQRLTGDIPRSNHRERRTKVMPHHGRRKRPILDVCNAHSLCAPRHE